MDDKFKLPNIPSIHVPQYRQADSHQRRSSSRSKNDASSSKSKSKSKSTGRESTPKVQAVPSPLNALPNLCPSCSTILLAYFQPLQQYINVMMSIALQRTEDAQYLNVQPPQLPPQLESLLNPEIVSAQQSDQQEPDTTTDHSQYSPSSISTNVSITPASSVKHSQHGEVHDSNSGRDSNEHHDRYYHHGARNAGSTQQDKSDGNVNQDRREQASEARQDGSHAQPSQYVGHHKEHGLQQSQQSWKAAGNEDTHHIPATRQNDDRSGDRAHHIEATQQNDQRSGDRAQNVNLQGSGVPTPRQEDAQGQSEQRDTSHSADQSNQLAKDGGQSSEQGNRHGTYAGAVSGTLGIRQADNRSKSRQNVFYGRTEVDHRQDTSRSDSEEDEDEQQESEYDEQPYAFVTMAYSNLSAANAVILANSVQLTSQRSVMLNGRRIEIPFVIILGGAIDPLLKNIIYEVFDDVITQPQDIRLSLLSDRTFGLHQSKLVLWRALKNYEKCLFIESSSLIVGEVSNLFLDCAEFSACVDLNIPDYFNCSVFVFEPNESTYTELVNFAILEQRTSDHNDEEDVDEMTVLNRYFAPKWNKLSFIYNFIQNSGYYTQQPAFLKFGGAVRIVNFGFNPMGSASTTQSPYIQPWHITFDLPTSTQSNDVVTAAQVNNYIRFYINLYLKRLWPIMQQPLTPQLVSRVGRRDWSIYELIRLLSSQSGFESDDHVFSGSGFIRPKLPSRTMQYEIEEVPHVAIEVEQKEKDDALAQSEGDSVQRETDADSTVAEAAEDASSDISSNAPALVEDLDSGMRAWESGKADWMGAHQSDKIIERLKGMIRK